jgi:hypothetical protein
MTMAQIHLPDDRLIDVCLEGEPLDAEAQHLADCAACEERRVRLAGLLEEVCDVAAAQADAYFTPDRLARQRAHVLERLEHEARHGRVISFPAAHAHAPALRARPGRRWIAGAAAAGLLIGFVAEHVAHRVPGGPSQPAALVAADAGPGTLQFMAVPLTEEEFLGRMEMAVEGTAGSALRPLDDLTPRVWEAAAQ